MDGAYARVCGYAKWGCVIECLAQKYYIEDDTDAILEEIDAALVVHRKR